MKITRSRLRQIIKEEVSSAIFEAEPAEEEADAGAEEKDPTHAILVSGVDTMGMTRVDVRVAEVATGEDLEDEDFDNNIGGAKAHIQDMMKKYPEYVLKVDSESPDVKALEDTKPA